MSQIEDGTLLWQPSEERKGASRTTVLHRIDALRGDEPWPGYDDQSVEEIRTALDGADESRLEQVREYERQHKDRVGVLREAERHLSRA